MITAMPRIAIVTRDFDLAITTFRDVLGMPVLDFSDRTTPELGARVAMCMPEGGSNIELMAPADPTKPLSQALQRTLDRRGEGPYALMLEAPVPDDEAIVLSERGLDVLPLMAGAGGRDIHPRSTHGVLIRVYPDGSVQRPDSLTSNAPGLSGIIRVIVATDDASVATAAYGGGLGLDTGPAVEDDERGVLCAVVRPPKGGVIELVSATDVSRPLAADIERFVKEEHQGIYALVLHAEDPAVAVSLLQARGLALGGAEGRVLSICGTRFHIE